MTTKNPKKVLAIAILVVVVLSLLVYELSHDSRGIAFRVVVNGQGRGSLMIEGINKWNGIDSDEATKIADAIFEFVMGQKVLGILESLDTTLGFVEAHYVWGYNTEDLGHVFDMKANLWTETIEVTHCK